jgi:hypothetical protein
MKNYKKLEDKMGCGEIVRADLLKGSSQLGKPLFHTAIYVNRNPRSLRDASHKREASEPLTEHKPWTTGEKLLAQAQDVGRELPLIFGYYQKLEYWAVAREIVVETDVDDKRVTRYRFADLHRIPGRQRERKDLTVLKTKSSLPNNFIRSYVLVETPGFLQPRRSLG